MNTMVALPILGATQIPAPPMPADRTFVSADIKLLELGRQYEDMLAVERPLARESSRLHRAADRRQREIMGFDPDDDNFSFKIGARWQEGLAAWATASKEVRYDQAARAWNRACRRTARVGKEIMKLQATTPAGLLVKARVVETHDEICRSEAPQQLMAEIRAFARAA
jgi:hypothetical protein